MLIVIVDNLIPAPNKISQFFRSDKLGSAQAHFKCVQGITEEQACEILKHLRTLNGFFTAESLFRELNTFKSSIHDQTGESVEQKTEQAQAFRI